MDEKNRKIVMILSFLRNFISVFFNLFFNIYVLKIVNDLSIIILVNLVSTIVSCVGTQVLLDHLNSQKAKDAFITSFLLLVICILALIGLKENIVNYLLLFKLVYAMQEVCFYGPLEMIIMGANKHNSMSSFEATFNILTTIATLITPIFSGFIIEKFTYDILFIPLSIEAIILIAISTKISNFYVEDRKADVKGFIAKAKNYPHLKDAYKCMFYRRLSTQGIIVDLLPIVLYLKVGSELSVGAYNSTFAGLSMIALMILKLADKRNVNKKFYIPFASIVFASTLILVFKPSFLTLMIYFVCMKTFAVVIESESCSMVYESINVGELSKYNREHDIVFNRYMCAGQVISCVLAFILYKYFYNANILSIMISILMFFLIISSVYLQKTEKFLSKNRN